jgi:hypothetical protein
MKPRFTLGQPKLSIFISRDFSVQMSNKTIEINPNKIAQNSIFFPLQNACILHNNVGLISANLELDVFSISISHDVQHGNCKNINS